MKTATEKPKQRELKPRDDSKDQPLTQEEFELVLKRVSRKVPQDRAEKADG